MDNNLNIVYRDLNDLIEAEYNPRQLSEQEFTDIHDSLKRFGLVDPLLVNMHKTRENILIGGHQRKKIISIAADNKIQFKGVKYQKNKVLIPCIELSLTLAKERELNIRLNKNQGEWDYDMLSTHFDLPELQDWGFSEAELVGFAEQELPNEEQSEVPDTPKKAVTKSGDLYELNGHRVLCGDSIDADHLKKLMGKAVFDIIITDPPYNVEYDNQKYGPKKSAKKAHAKIENDKKTDKEFYKFIYQFYHNYSEYCRPGAPYYIFHADSEAHNFRQAFLDTGHHLAQGLIWLKNHMVLSRQDYHWQHEPIIYGWKEGGAHPWHSDRKQTTILEFDRPTASKIHPTISLFPATLHATPIQQSSFPSNNIPSPCGNSPLLRAFSQSILN